LIAFLLHVPMFFDGSILSNKWIQLLLASFVQFGIGGMFYKRFWYDLKNFSFGMYTLIALGPVEFLKI